MIAQFKQDLYNKSLTHQDQDKRVDGLQKRKKIGSTMLLICQNQYQIMFMIMIIMRNEWIIFFEGQSTIRSLEN